MLNVFSLVVNRYNKLNKKDRNPVSTEIIINILSSFKHKHIKETKVINKLAVIATTIKLRLAKYEYNNSMGNCSTKRKITVGVPKDIPPVLKKIIC
ncbi:MAG: hypothetical protein LBB56_02040 [Chitinispirillales bacterium]|jgi:hypothetical protein|nr:hypothetical protein [Chitinispirillales bacterium]